MASHFKGPVLGTNRFVEVPQEIVTRRTKWVWFEDFGQHTTLYYPDQSASTWDGAHYAGRQQDGFGPATYTDETRYKEPIPGVQARGPRFNQGWGCHDIPQGSDGAALIFGIKVADTTAHGALDLTSTTNNEGIMLQHYGTDVPFKAGGTYHWGAKYKWDWVTGTSDGFTAFLGLSQDRADQTTETRNVLNTDGTLRTTSGPNAWLGFHLSGGGVTTAVVNENGTDTEVGTFTPQFTTGGGLDSSFQTELFVEVKVGDTNNNGTIGFYQREVPQDVAFHDNTPLEFVGSYTGDLPNPSLEFLVPTIAIMRVANDGHLFTDFMWMSGER